MKTTEEVIKNKNRLIAGRERYYSFSERLLQTQVGKPIYIVDNYYCKNTIELVKEITPLVYYIISILKTEEENLDKELILLIEFPNSNGVVRVDGRFMIDDENVLACLANSIKDLEDDGYHVTFTQNFELHFLLKDQFLLDYEDEIEEETQEKQNEEKKIPASHLNQMIVLYVWIPLLMFYYVIADIYVYVKNVSKQFDRCPICKTDITVLRIVE